jgi:hypothetical protein
MFWRRWIMLARKVCDCDGFILDGVLIVMLGGRYGVDQFDADDDAVELVESCDGCRLSSAADSHCWLERCRDVRARHVSYTKRRPNNDRYRHVSAQRDNCACLLAEDT